MAQPSPAPAVAGGDPPVESGLARGAMFALAVLFSMNLLNYVDRYVFAAVGPAIIRDIGTTKAGFGWLSSSFIIVYTIVSPLVGILGDRLDRRKILAFGVALWSVATVGTAFARTFNHMFLARAVLGVGEASYGVIAPTLLADFFDIKRRGRIMGIFYLALPVGTALGYMAGGFMEHLAGWPSAFWVVGPPGILLALFGLLMREPGRGASDGRADSKAAPPGVGEYLRLFAIPSYVFNTLGMAAVTFTTGAFGIWIPAYFEYVHKTPPDQKAVLGIALALAGLTGVLIGMWLPDRLRKRTDRAYMLWAGLAVFLAIPFGAAGILTTHSKYGSLALLTVASVLLTSCLGPCNTVTANVVPGSRRAMGYAVSIFLLHLFGDIPSPPLIGYASDYLSRPGHSPAQSFLARLGAVPVFDGHGLTNITAGLLLIVPVLLLGSLCFLLGSYSLPRDQERARASGDGEVGAMIIH